MRDYIDEREKLAILILRSSIVLKIVVIILSYKKDTYKKRELLSVALSSMVLLFIISAIVWGIYYIGKIMTAMG